MAKSNYFFCIQFNGTAFRGWQNQKDGLSVQETIEKVLTEICKTPTIIYGCGRTDAGVHASNYIFNAFISDDVKQLKFKLNKRLPESISVKSITQVPDNCRAQKDATLRIYTYYFHLEKEAYLSTFSTWVPHKNLDFEKINSALACIEKARDFKNYCLSPEKHYSTLCRISKAEVFAHNNKNQFAFRFSGDHYLKSMIRLLVGDLFEVGLGRLSVEDFEHYLNYTLPKPKHHKAYPQGLHLSFVCYPFGEPIEITPPFYDGLFY